jgi:two-component system CheB/CheR fusion protein
LTAHGVVLTFLDITSIIRSEARQQVLIAELQHRTRNLLTLIQSTAQKTLGPSPQVAEFSSRLDALSRVQGLLGGHLADAIALRDMVDLELTALCIPQDRVRVSGPAVLLGFDAVQTFSLALHAHDQRFEARRLCRRHGRRTIADRVVGGDGWLR